MKRINIFKDSNKVASAFTAVAAGMLTDMLYDLLAEEHFEGSVANETLEIIKINEYSVLQRICIIVFLFVFLWALFSYGIPLVGYWLNSLRTRNIPRLSKEEVSDRYKECKQEVIILQERTQNVTDPKAHLLLFNDTCQVIIKLHKVFCSGKKENDNVVKNSFRTGSTIYDIGTKLSLYEYLAITEILQEILTLSHNNIPVDSGDLVESDYKNILSFLKDLKMLLN